MKNTKRKAFTIVELVIVIAVIAVLATVLVPTFGDVIEKAQDSKAMQAAKNACTNYIIDNGGVASEYMIYEADGRFVALHNGAAVGVYESQEEAVAAIVDNPADFFATDTENPQLFLLKYRDIPKVEWEVGTITTASGTNSDNSTRLRTTGYLQLSDFGGVTVNAGYEITYLVYDANKVYLGNGLGKKDSNWLGSGVGITTADIKAFDSSAVYFRLALKKINAGTITTDDLAASGIQFYAADEKVPVPEIDLKYTNLFSVGSWQDGAIWDGKLFVFGVNGTGQVYDLSKKTLLGTIALDKTDVLKPHANSVCFGNTKYDENDQYPLLYVNIYNNYSNSTDRMEGTCCVYRLTESAGGFSTQLVQVIRIGFTEDLALWKSMENNKDTRPYGNFVVDTDKNKLYAFVMRDANQTTRFFAFEIPALGSGDYNETYGCNVVTLKKEDIQSQFDVEYFNYIQGCCYSNGQIISAEGFGNSTSVPPTIRIVDLETQKVVKTYNLTEAGLPEEPEVICVDPTSNALYFAAANGLLRVLTLSD